MVVMARLDRINATAQSPASDEGSQTFNALDQPRQSLTPYLSITICELLLGRFIKPHRGWSVAIDFNYTTIKHAII
jgi:hypothetical protein